MAQTQIGRAVNGVWWALVIRGLIGIAIGFFIFARPLDSVAVFALVIAFWALMQGVVGIAHSFELRTVAPHWWLLLLSGLISTGFGVAALYYYPALSLSFAVVWVAWWLLLGGFAGISVAAMERRVGMSWGWTLALGILSVVAAAFALMSPPATLAALMSLISAFAILSGVLYLAGAYRLRTAAGDIAAAVNRQSAA